MSECKAKVYVKGAPEVDDQNTVSTTFRVVVSGCAESSGDFDYVVTYETSSGDEKSKRVTGNWPRQKTTGQIETTELYDLASDEALKGVEALEDATRCVCFAS